MGVTRAEDSCVCVVETPALSISTGGAMALRATPPAMQLKVAHTADCEGRYAGRVFGVSGQRWSTSGTSSAPASSASRAG